MPPSSETEATDADAGRAWHTLSVGEVLERLEVDGDVGLSDDEAAQRRERHGRNELVHDEGSGIWGLVVDQFAEPLVIVLLAAAVVSAGVWWAESTPEEALPWDAVVILAIVVLNAVIGFVQEYRAERAVETLKDMTAPEARVRRDGEVRSVEASEVVPGDILILEDGSRVVADARVLESASLKVEEAALTGESEPVSKGTEALQDPDLAVGDRRNMVFMASAVTYGHGEAVVVATGMETEVGDIADLLRESTDEDTPLQRELGRVGRQLGYLVLGISVVVAVAGVLREGALTLDVALQMFLFAVALAVAAVPEGLPAVVTATLALGMRRLAARNAVVRSLPAVEALGSATVICTDKTGTLTRNEMTVRRILLGDGRTVSVEGEGYAPRGAFRVPDGDSEPGTDGTGATAEGEEADPAEVPGLCRLLRLGALDNDASLEEADGSDGSGERTEGTRWSARGDPTEAALVVAAEKAGIDVPRLRDEHPRKGEIPFSSERRRMTTVHDLDGTTVAVVKGAPEVVIERCTRIRRGDEVEELGDDGRRELLEANEAFAARALRTLAVASGSVDPAPDDPDADTIERELVFEGLVGMIDPPRGGAAEAVSRAGSAGVRTLMVTGDHVATARAIAAEIGIGADTEDGEGPEVLSGRDISEMDEAEVDGAVARCSVYGRVDPRAKHRIVEALQRRGEVVAMTGDGVNDAPAVKSADIGVAMGRSGSDVTREAGDIVLADDDYATIVAAVEEGRTIYANLKSFVRYLLSANAGEVLTIFGAVLAAGLLGLEGETGGFVLPLLAVQILWVNLITDGPPALALGVTPAEPDVMRRSPRDPDAAVIDGPMWTLIAVSGLVIMAGTLGVLDAYLPGGMIPMIDGPEGADPLRRARTMAFTTLVMFQMVHVFNCLSPDRSLFQGGVLRNRWLLAAVAGSLLLHVAVIYLPLLQRAFETVALRPVDWGIAGAVSLSLVVAVELLKRTPLISSPGPEGD